MNLTRVVICVILMALVTYIPRVLPVTIFRKEIKSRFIRSFLDYTPLCGFGGFDIPGCLFLNRAFLFGGRRNAGGGNSRLQGQEPGSGCCGRDYFGLPAGTGRGSFGGRMVDGIRSILK